MNRPIPVAPEAAIELLYTCAHHLRVAHRCAVEAARELAAHPRHDSAIQLAHVIEGAESHAARLRSVLAAEGSSCEHERRWEQ
jgi:hypothetical protein